MEEKEALNIEEAADEAIEEEIVEEAIEVGKSTVTWRRIERFLSTFAAISLSIMSIIISVISVNNEKDSKAIAAMELDILQNDREAYFVVKDSKPLDSQEEYAAVYTIENKGGRVSGFRVKPFVELCVYMSDFKPSEMDEKTGKMTQGYFYDKVYTVILKNTSFTVNGTHDSYDYNVYNENTQNFEIHYKLNKAFVGKLRELEKDQIRVNTNTEFSYYMDTGVLIKYCNYKNEVKEQEYLVTSNAVAAENGPVLEDVEEEEVYYSIEEYSEEEAEKLIKYIKSRFELDLKVYLANQKKVE